MAIFSKLRGKKEAQKAKAAAPVEPTKPREKYMHIPRHAARDAMASAPAQWKPEDREKILAQNRERLSRPGSSYSVSRMSMMSAQGGHANPKLNMSRNSSAMSFDHYSPPQIQQDWHAQRPSSYQSLPRLLHEGPPVPAIPAQYASQAPSAVPSRAGSRRSSFVGAPVSHNGTAPPSPSRPRHSRSQFHNASALAKSPLQSQDTSPLDSEEDSNASTTSGENLEMPQRTRHDSYVEPYMYSHAAGKAPMPRYTEHSSPVSPMEEAAPRKYFGHARPESTVLPAAAPVSPVMNTKKSRFSFMKRGQAVAAH